MTTLSEKFAWNIATDADRALTDAAPELLAALKNLLANTDRPCSKPIGAPGSVARIEQEHRDRLYNEAMKTIAKAEGR